MKKCILGLFIVAICASVYGCVCNAKEIIIDSKDVVSLDEKDIAPINPPAYKQVQDKDFDVKVNNPEYIKDIPAINKKRKFDLQLKKPSIQPYHP